MCFNKKCFIFDVSIYVFYKLENSLEIIYIMSYILSFRAQTGTQAQKHDEDSKSKKGPILVLKEIN